MSDDELPQTIVAGKGATMTFLRNEEYLLYNEISPGDGFSVPPHWHPVHDEYFRVFKGRMEVTIGSNTRIYTPKDGEVFISKGTVHSLRTFKGEHVIFKERTEPRDDGKEVLFRNMLPLMEEGMPANVTAILQIALSAYYGDMRPGLPGHFLWLETAIVAILGGVIAPLLGYKLRYTSRKKQT